MDTVTLDSTVIASVFKPPTLVDQFKKLNINCEMKHGQIVRADCLSGIITSEDIAEGDVETGILYPVLKSCKVLVKTLTSLDSKLSTVLSISREKVCWCYCPYGSILELRHSQTGEELLTIWAFYDVIVKPI